MYAHLFGRFTGLRFYFVSKLYIYVETIETKRKKKKMKKLSFLVKIIEGLSCIYMVCE